jgi:hypothetical protein
VRAERLAGVLPLVTIYIWLCLLYGWEAWGNLTPWLFTDELEHTQFSRAIAETGRAARRGVEQSPDSLYAYIVAPAWWIHDTSAAYGVAKAIGIAAMTAAIFPTYALARMLVSKPAALVTATLTVSIPAFAYSSLLLQEPLAYGWAALALWLATRALVTPARGWIAAAVAVALVAPFVRSELVVVPAAFVVGAALWWLTGARGIAWRRGWSTWDWAGFLLLAIGAVIMVNGLASSHSAEWLSATQHYKGRMVENGAWAIGAFVIGIGILPAAAAIAALAPGRWSLRPPAERAFLCIALPTLLGYAWYTAVKAAYISTVFSTLVEERNFIYAGPAIFLLAALFFDRQRTHVAALVAAAGLLVYLIVKTPFHMYEHFYADAPGLSILQSANRVLSLTPGSAQIVLLVIAALCLAFVAAAAFFPGRWLGAAVAVAALLVLGWNLTGQITGARSSHEFGDQLLSNFPRPLDWVDEATGRAPTVYYGQRVDVDPNGPWLLEFWNRSIQGLWTLDGSGVGPGPTVTPDVVKPTGEIKLDRKFDYAVTDEGVNLVGQVVAQKTHLAGGAPATWRLYRVAQPMRLRKNVEGFYPDGWTGERSAYSQFSTAENRRGYLIVDVNRAGGGKTLPANVRLEVGDLVIGEDTQPKLGRVRVARTFSAPNDLSHQFLVEAPPAPFRAEVRVWPPFSPHDLDPQSGDLRELGAQVSFRFVPKLPLPIGGRAPQTTGVYRDGWMGETATHTVWGGVRAPLPVTLARPAGPGTARVKLRVTRLGFVNKRGSLRLQEVSVADERVVPISRGTKTVTLDAPRPPYRVTADVSPTFVPLRVVPGSQDDRELGVRINFGSR